MNLRVRSPPPFFFLMHTNVPTTSSTCAHLYSWASVLPNSSTVCQPSLGVCPIISGVRPPTSAHAPTDLGYVDTNRPMPFLAALLWCIFALVPFPFHLPVLGPTHLLASGWCLFSSPSRSTSCLLRLFRPHTILVVFHSHCLAIRTFLPSFLPSVPFTTPTLQTARLPSLSSRPNFSSTNPLPPRSPNHTCSTPSAQPHPSLASCQPRDRDMSVHFLWPQLPRSRLPIPQIFAVFY